MKNIIVLLITTLFFTAGFSQTSSTLSKERKELALKRVAEINVLLDYQNEGRFSIDLDLMKLAYINAMECITTLDIRKKVYINVDYRPRVKQDKSTKMYYCTFSNFASLPLITPCSSFSNTKLSIKIKGFVPTSIFHDMVQDLFNILFAENYNVNKVNDFKIKEKVATWTLEEQKKQQIELAAKEKQKVQKIPVNDANRKELALKQIKRINKLTKSGEYFELNFEKLKLTFITKEEKKKVILTPNHIAFTDEGYRWSTKIKIEGEITASIVVNFSSNKNPALECNARLTELFEILFGDIKSVEPSSISSLSNHPQLKYLGKSVYDPEVQELLKNNENYVKLNEVISNNKIGVKYQFDSYSKLITRIRFSNVKGRSEAKYKDYKKLPTAVKNVKIEPTSGGVYYRLAGGEYSKLYAKSYETYISSVLEKRKNESESYLIKSREDLDRYYDPKGDDIFEILDKRDPLFDEYYIKRGNSQKNRKNCYLYNFKADNIRIKRCPIKKSELEKVYYNIESGNFSKKEFKERFPYDIDLDKGLDVVLSQLANVEGFKEVVRKETYSEDIYIGKKEIAVEITVVKIETKGVMRYVILKRKVSNLEYKFYSISISNDNYNGYLGDFRLINVNSLKGDFIKTKEDLERFYDPKGEDVLTLLDSRHSKPFEEYLLAKGIKPDTENGNTTNLKQDGIRLRRFPLIYSITSLDFINNNFTNRFPYDIDLSKGVNSVISQLKEMNIVEKIDQGRSNTLITINDKGVKRYIQLKGFRLENEDSFHTIAISNSNLWEIGNIKYQSAEDYKLYSSLKRRAELDALKKEGIYYPIDGSESKTIGAPLMTFKIRKDKTVEVVEIDVYTIDNPSTPLRYWKSKVLKSIDGVAMKNMNWEKLKKVCRGTVGKRIVIVNEEGISYEPRRVYWFYGDIKTIDFDILFPNREQGVSEGSFTWKGFTYTGEYIVGNESKKLPRGEGTWEGKNNIYQGFWISEPNGSFTVTDKNNTNKYATGTFKNGIPTGKWVIHDLENSYNTDFELIFNGKGKVISTPDMAEVSTKIERSSSDERTVIYFNLRQYEQYSPLKLVYSIAYLTGDCECKNESTAATLDYTEYYYSESGKKQYSYFPSAICAELKEGHVTNLSESDLNNAIDEEIWQLWDLDTSSGSILYEVFSKSNIIGRSSKTFSKVYAPSITKDCTTEKEVKEVSWKKYDIWFRWD